MMYGAELEQADAYGMIPTVFATQIPKIFDCNARDCQDSPDFNK